LIPSMGFKENFTIFGMNHEWTQMLTNYRKEKQTTDDTDYTNWGAQAPSRAGFGVLAETIFPSSLPRTPRNKKSNVRTCETPAQLRRCYLSRFLLSLDDPSIRVSSLRICGRCSAKVHSNAHTMITVKTRFAITKVHPPAPEAGALPKHP
jgi:hypothetical protein